MPQNLLLSAKSGFHSGLGGGLEPQKPYAKSATDFTSRCINNKSYTQVKHMLSERTVEIVDF